MSETFTVATANTHEGRMLRDADGLAPFTDGGVDTLLMQEVLGVDQPDLEARLLQDNYTLAHFDRPSGLAIAVNRDSAFQTQEGSERTEVLQAAEKIGEVARRLNIDMANRLRQRGLIAVKLASAESTVTVATTHPIVFVRALARAKQVGAIGEVLDDEYYRDDPLVVGGDMNHYPGPRKVDLRMHAATGLTAVEFDEATWRIAGSRHHWLAAIGSRVTGREIDSFDAELDAILYRGLVAGKNSVVDITSDHRAAISDFSW